MSTCSADDYSNDSADECDDVSATFQALDKKSDEDVGLKTDGVPDLYAKLTTSTIVLDVELISNRILKFIDVKPSILSKTRKAFQLWARNDKYTYVSSKSGKWMPFVEPELIDAVWYKIQAFIISGDLWGALLLFDKKYPTNSAGLFPIMVYTIDYTDLDDVIRVLDVLETTGLKKGTSIKYKTDDQTRAGIYAWKNNGPASIFNSFNVRDIRKKRYSNSKYIPTVDFEKSKIFY